MWAYLGKRTLQMLVTLILFQAITYLLIDAQPGDIADLLTMNPDIPPAEVERMRAELGLDKGPFERMVNYIANFYQGDLGVSFMKYPIQVTDIIAERLPRSTSGGSARATRSKLAPGSASSDLPQTAIS